MPRYFLVFFVLALVVLVAESKPDGSKCGRHGDPCVSDSQCCASTKCHRFANRCQVQITEDELMKQREKILGRRGKDY